MIRNKTPYSWDSTELLGIYVDTIKAPRDERDEILQFEIGKRMPELLGSTVLAQANRELYRWSLAKKSSIYQGLKSWAQLAVVADGDIANFSVEVPRTRKVGDYLYPETRQGTPVYKYDEAIVEGLAFVGDEIRMNFTNGNAFANANSFDINASAAVARIIAPDHSRGVAPEAFAIHTYLVDKAN